MIEDQRQCISPSELNTYLKHVLEDDSQLLDIWVEGEITQLKHYKIGGQIYFYLSDGSSQVNCVMYDSGLSRLSFEPKEGLTVRARGKIKLFPKRGSINLQVSYMMPVGAGSLAQRFLELKKKLTSEGLFNPDVKKSIPAHAKKVALITSLDSAAMSDFLTVMKHQAPQIAITVLPATMQGADCPNSVSKALRIAHQYQKFDVIVIARGGGSNEDLSGFNDENLVRTMYETQLPIISAVGHEVDVTLSDFVSDLRAQTPTEAAHILSRPTAHLKARLFDAHSRASRLFTRLLTQHTDALFDLFQDASLALNQRIEKLETTLQHLHHRAEVVNPLHKLKQGFSICKHSQTQRLVRSIKDISSGDEIMTQLTDGSILSKVTHYEQKKD